MCNLCASRRGGEGNGERRGLRPETEVINEEKMEMNSQFSLVIINAKEKFGK